MTNPYAVEDFVDSIELAALNYDQWIVTVALRAYAAGDVVGMVHLTFTAVAGFRCLDEGDMLSFPWPENATRWYVHRLSGSGWLNQEQSLGNTTMGDDTWDEYLVATGNECVSIIAQCDPVITKELPHQ